LEYFLKMHDKAEPTMLRRLFWLFFTPLALAQVPVGMGRLSSESVDSLGEAQTTLGGLFSCGAFAVPSWQRSILPNGHHIYSGRLLSVPDRLSPALDTSAYACWLSFQLTWETGVVLLSPERSLRLTSDGVTPISHAGPDDLTHPAYPRAAFGSPGNGKQCLDAEGVVLTREGAFYVADEYGPYVYQFSAAGVLQAALRPPEAFLPRAGTSYGSRVIDYGTTRAIHTGRRGNGGFEGLAISPDQKRLYALLQVPLLQDNGISSLAQNTRLLVWDIEAGSPRFHQPVAEYIYQLTLQGNETGTRQTSVTEILALNRHQLLVLERDGRGAFGSQAGTPLYKRVVSVELTGATNILGTGYDLEEGAPGHLALPAGALPTGLRAVQRRDFIDLLAPAALAKFGLNLNVAAPDANTMPEKWETLALLPLNQPQAPEDFLLLIGSDNDYRSRQIYANGALISVGVNTADHLLLAYRVTLPGAALNAIPELEMQPDGLHLRPGPNGFPHFYLEQSSDLTPATWTTTPLPWHKPRNAQRQFYRLRELPYVELPTLGR
jgi:hypothetical protein